MDSLLKIYTFVNVKHKKSMNENKAEEQGFKNRYIACTPIFSNRRKV